MKLGPLEYFSNKLCGGSTLNSKKKQFQTVELKVRMDCEGCERKVNKAASRISGVQTVDVNRKMQKVTIAGYVDPKKVMRKMKATGKRVELYPYVPYNSVSQPMVSSQTYDKKAPPGMVRRVELDSVPSSNRLGDQYTTMLSEENPNACSVM